MSRSILEGATLGGKHTYRDFGLIAKSPMVIAPPEPKTEYVDVPGADGSLDYTEVLTGDVKYKDREGSWTFVVMDGDDWAARYSKIATYLHGRKMAVVLDNDPQYYYTGRLSVDNWQSNRWRSEITINYVLAPYAYPFSSTLKTDWLWDDLFDLTIYYGTFYVDGTKSRNIINPTGKIVTPTINCASQMTVDFNGSTYTLPAGNSTLIDVSPGDNIMEFKGTGVVKIDYPLLEKKL